MSGLGGKTGGGGKVVRGPGITCQVGEVGVCLGAGRGNKGHSMSQMFLERFHDSICNTTGEVCGAKRIFYVGLKACDKRSIRVAVPPGVCRKGNKWLYPSGLGQCCTDWLRLDWVKLTSLCHLEPAYLRAGRTMHAENRRG